MRAAVVASVGEVCIETVDDPTPGTGEVVVEVAACGLCGTDLHIVQGEFAPSLPLIPGHEFAGVVVACGPGAESVRVGDRVAVDPSLYCYECHYCRIGRNNLCQRWGGIGVTVASPPRTPRSSNPCPARCAATTCSAVSSDRTCSSTGRAPWA